MCNQNPTFRSEVPGVMVVCTKCHIEVNTSIERNDADGWEAEIECPDCGRLSRAVGPAPTLVAMSALAYWTALHK